MIFGMEPTGGSGSLIAWEVLVGLPLIAACFVAAVFVVLRQVMQAKGSDCTYVRPVNAAGKLRLEEMRGDPREFEVSR